MAITGIGTTLLAAKKKFFFTAQFTLKNLMDICPNVVCPICDELFGLLLMKRSERKDHLSAILAIIFAVLRDNKSYVPASTT